MNASVTTARGLRGEIVVPGDKSICHRTVMLGALAGGRSRARGFNASADTLATVNCLRAMGCVIDINENGEIEVGGVGTLGLREPEDVLNAANSGTTARLLSGILSGQPFLSVLTGDSSLRRRPMGRVVEPLSAMGASIWGRDRARYLPLAIQGNPLRPVSLQLPAASAQVKSAILLAALFAEGETTVVEPAATRDHTERMLAAMGARVTVGPHPSPLPEGKGVRETGPVDEMRANEIRVFGPAALEPFDLTVPGDFSSAAFFLAAAALVPDSDLAVLNVGLNPTRTGFLDILREMGARIEVFDERVAGGEPVGGVRCRTSDLKGVSIDGEMVARAIDELPALAVLATQAEGETIVRGARELRVKESDRISTVVTELSRLGASVEELPDGFVVRGPSRLRGAFCSTYGDHRLAMSLAVAGLVAAGETQIESAECVDVSFPGFFDKLARIAG